MGVGIRVVDQGGSGDPSSGSGWEWGSGGASSVQPSCPIRIPPSGLHLQQGLAKLIAAALRAAALPAAFLPVAFLPTARMPSAS